MTTTIDAGAPLVIDQTKPTEPPAVARIVSNWQMALYALPEVPLAFLLVPLSVLLPAFYAKSVGLGLSAVGGFLLLARLSDMVADPIIGRLSDITRSRGGRRKIWILAGTPALMAATYVLFIPPGGATGWYLMGASLLLYLAHSAVNLPYRSWGTEIVESYHGRSKLSAFYFAAALIGSFIAAMVPAVTSSFGHGIDRFTMSIVGWVVIGSLPLAVVAATATVQEPLSRTDAPRETWASMLAPFRNGPFRLLWITFMIFFVGVSVATTTLVFYISNYLDRPRLVGPALLGAVVVGMAATPVWVWASGKFGKHKTLAAALTGLTVLCICTALVPREQPMIFLVLLALTAGINPAYLTLSSAMIGDTIDYDTFRHGTSRAGLYWGVWSFGQKLAPALAVGATLPLLDRLGFHAATASSESGLLALRLTYALGPMPFAIIGAILILKFPINAKKHHAIRKRIAQRAGRQ